MAGFQIQAFDLFPGPGSFPEEFQAGIHRWIVGKTADIDLLPEFFPAIFFYQGFQNTSKLESMQGVVRLLFRIFIISVLGHVIKVRKNSC